MATERRNEVEDPARCTGCRRDPQWCANDRGFVRAVGDGARSAYRRSEHLRNRCQWCRPACTWSELCRGIPHPRARCCDPARWHCLNHPSPNTPHDHNLVGSHNRGCWHHPDPLDQSDHRDCCSDLWRRTVERSLWRFRRCFHGHGPLSDYVRGGHRHRRRRCRVVPSCCSASTTQKVRARRLRRSQPAPHQFLMEAFRIASKSSWVTSRGVRDKSRCCFMAPSASAAT